MNGKFWRYSANVTLDDGYLSNILCLQMSTMLCRFIFYSVVND